MREVLTSVLVLGLLFATAACTEDTTRPDTNVVPLKIDNIQLSGVSLRSSDPLESGDIGLFRLAGSGYSGTSNNVKYTYSGGGWSAASGVTPIYLSKSTANLCAYYPYSSDADYSDGQVTLTSQRYDNTKDLCYQTGVTASSEAAASFTLEHAYAMITFTLTRSATYPGTCAISNLSLANAGLLTSNTLDMTTGTTGTYGSGTTGTITVLPSIAGIASGSSETVSVLMVPVTTSMSGDIQLSLTVDDRALSTTISTTTLPKLEAGKNYNITATINGASLTITSVTTTDWADVTAGTVNNAMLAEEANCYMLPLGQTVYIPVSRVVAGQIAAGNSGFTLSSVSWTAGLLWTTSSDGLDASGCVQVVSYNTDGGYIKVTAGTEEGNSVIAMYDTDGTTILWSWHIWTTNYNPNTPSNGTTHTLANSVTSNVFMDRNLGAAGTAYSNDNNILHYQWGRKDPFPAAGVYDASGASASVDITTYTAAQALSVSVQHPFAFILSSADWNTSPNDALWGGASSGATKTIFDPCPAGWRVPSFYKTSTAKSPWEYLAYSSGAFTFSSLGYGGIYTTGAGWPFTLNSVSIGFYPAAGYRDGSSGALDGVGSYGAYWSASPNSSNGYSLYIDSSYVYPSNGGARVHGVSVRCVQE